MYHIILALPVKAPHIIQTDSYYRARLGVCRHSIGNISVVVTVQSSLFVLT
jgi:hypothetical protein